MNCTAEMLRLYAVTDRAWVGRQTLPQQVEAALKGGATCVQLREKELDEFLSYIDNPPRMDAELSAVIAHDREELCGEFCRGCGYCMPCPKGIDIPGTFRCYNELYTGSRKAGKKEYLMTTAFRKKQNPASGCAQCGKCEQHCPQQIPIRQKFQRTGRSKI